MPGPVLTEAEVRALEAWVRTAQSWAESAQTLVDAAGELTLASRDLADRFGDGDGDRRLPAGEVDAEAGGVDRGALKSDLRRLAETVEDDSHELRNRYLATAASIDQYHGLLG